MRFFIKIKKMKSKTLFFGIFLAVFASLLVIFLLSCFRNNTPKNNITNSELQESKQQINISVLRYDRDLFALDLNNLPKEVERLSKQYPPFLIEPGVWNNPEQLERLKAYLQDTVIIALYKAAEKTVKMDNIIKELETAFGYYKVFYPNDSIPEIITLLPGLDLTMPSVYFYDNFLCINVDMYLGKESHYYSAVGLPLYIAERCDPVYLSVDIFKKAIVDQHLNEEHGNTIIENMIFEGKKLYFTEMMLPDMPERYIIGYPEEKFDWANQYVGNIWNYMIEKNELFGKGDALMRCYIEESPFTKQFGNDSPGRLGIFLGWKLVQSYMANNPEVTLPELMQTSDYQKILDNSKFKPQAK